MKIITINLILILYNLSLFAQKTESNKDKITLVSSYKVSDNYIYCTNKNGDITIWNTLKKAKTDSIQITGTFFTCVSKDTDGDIFFGSKQGDIYKFDKKEHKLSIFLSLKRKKSKNEIHKIYFNSKNELFIILSNGIYSASKNKLWSKFDQRGTIVSLRKKTIWGHRIVKKFFTVPDYLYQDKKGVIWMSKSYGEWGSSSHRFDIENEKIIKNDDDNYMSPDYLFEDTTGKIFGTNGSMHFFQFGSINIINGNKIIKTIDSKTLKTSDKKLISENGIMLGPATYNQYNHKFYFSTTKGIFSADFNKNEFINFKEYWNPTLNWKQEPLAIGVAMSYKELEFIEKNKLVILTTTNGLVLLDNDKEFWLN